MTSTLILSCVFLAVNIVTNEAGKPILRGGVDYDDQLDTIPVRYDGHNEREKRKDRYRDDDVYDKLGVGVVGLADAEEDLKRTILTLLLLDAKSKNDRAKTDTDESTDSSLSKELGPSNKEEEDNNVFNVLRKNIWKKCGKNASKICYKACCDAASSACSRYSCKKNLKKRLKKECKTACNDRFVG